MNQNIEDIDLIVIHMSETPPEMDIGVKTIKVWHKKRGFNDVGYHFVVRKNGSVELGRALTTVGAHTKGKNRNSIGICYVGGWNGEDDRTCEQKESITAILMYLRVILPNTRLVVKGHNDFSDKTCPNFDASKEYEWV